MIAERVKRGVYEAGGFPVEFPVTSLGETLMRPTAMLFRNLVSMDVEESIRANPIDGVVLLAGCDKTTPALLMGAASCDLPTILVSGGPMLNGKYKGEDIGSGTSVWKFSEEVRSGAMALSEFLDAESCMSRSAGHCMTMGTASTMACMSEALGIAMPMNAAIPAVDSRRYVLAHQAGRRIVDLVREDVRASKILTRQAFENAITVNGAIGGSTNAVIHLLAIAGRIGVDLSLEDWDRLGGTCRVCQSHALGSVPHGGFLLCRRIAGADPRIGRPDSPRGPDGQRKTLWENVSEAPCYNREVISRSRARCAITAVSPCCVAISVPMARCSSHRLRPPSS
jgi:dihydroxy-acid dehydratase